MIFSLGILLSRTNKNTNLHNKVINGQTLQQFALERILERTPDAKGTLTQCYSRLFLSSTKHKMYNHKMSANMYIQATIVPYSTNFECHQAICKLVLTGSIHS